MKRMLEEHTAMTFCVHLFIRPNLYDIALFAGITVRMCVPSIAPIQSLNRVYYFIYIMVLATLVNESANWEISLFTANLERVGNFLNDLLIFLFRMCFSSAPAAVERIVVLNNFMNSECMS